MVLVANKQQHDRAGRGVRPRKSNSLQSIATDKLLQLSQSRPIVVASLRIATMALRQKVQRLSSPHQQAPGQYGRNTQ